MVLTSIGLVKKILTPYKIISFINNRKPFWNSRQVFAIQFYFKVKTNSSDETFSWRHARLLKQWISVSAQPSTYVQEWNGWLESNKLLHAKAYAFILNHFNTKLKQHVDSWLFRLEIDIRCSYAEAMRRWPLLYTAAGRPTAPPRGQMNSDSAVSRLLQRMHWLEQWLISDPFFNSTAVLCWW